MLDVVIITPIFEDTSAASQLMRTLAEVADTNDIGLHVVAVDDGSVAQPVSTNVLSDARISGDVLTLRRNVGHQQALAIGLSHAANELPGANCYLTMDSDGEDDPSAIPELLTALASSANVDVAVARRRARTEGIIFRGFYFVYRMLFVLLTGRTLRFGNFIAMSEAGLRRIVAMQETWIHLAASVLASRLRVRHVSVDRMPRFDGRSKMSFVSLAAHGFRSVMVFTEDVLVRVGVVCCAAAALSVVGMLTALFLKFAGFATPGWASTVLGLQLVIFLQTGAITLMLLMLSGVTKGNSAPSVDYRDLIERWHRVELKARSHGAESQFTIHELRIGGRNRPGAAITPEEWAS